MRKTRIKNNAIIDLYVGEKSLFLCKKDTNTLFWEV